MEIRVSDNGPGIPSPIRDRLFEPFVSYGKENGSGMGLAVAQKIIQDHGGEITVEKTSETGTDFRLIMPLTIASKEAPPNEGQKMPTGQVGGAKPAPIS